VDNVRCVMLADLFLGDIKTLCRLIDKLLLLLCAVRNEKNFAVFLFLILCMCISEPLICHVNNLRYSHILLADRNRSATEEKCHWRV
jgi:hypothetical protein